MNRKQRARRHERRVVHQTKTYEPDRPRLIMDRAEYTAVERAHIVPRMYQKAWAVEGKVAVHRVGDERCSLVGTKKVGTRDAYYRRTRPTGETIDDIEASLSEVESRSAPVLSAVVSGRPLDLDVKGALAQFFGVQLMRGPAFFEKREKTVLPMIEELQSSDFLPEALAAVGGDVEVARAKLKGTYADPTQRFTTMLQLAIKQAGILGNMRWQILRFYEPLLAYSDHPVVLWPESMKRTQPLKLQHLGPLSAIEVRVPISPDKAILMDWVDLPDGGVDSCSAQSAAEINAITVAQADTEWMHKPGTRPPIASGELTPLSPKIEPRYSVDAARKSARRAHAAAWFTRGQGRRWVNDLELLDVQLKP